MKNKGGFIIFLLYLLSLSFYVYLDLKDKANAFTLMDYAEYFVFTGEELTIGWDVSEGAEFYEVQLIQMENNRVISFPNVPVPNLTTTISCPRAGHYSGQIRACKTNTDNSKECSEWSKSTDLINGPTVNGITRVWRLSAYPSPTGPIIIK